MAQRYVVIDSNGEEHEALVNRRGGGLDIELYDKMHRVRLIPEGPPTVYLLTDTGHRHEVAVERHNGRLRIQVRGRHYDVEVLREGQRRHAAAAQRGPSEREAGDGAWTLLSPMTGMIRSIEVKDNDRVEPNTVLLVIEAMKMQNELRAVRSATVHKIHVLPGDRIEQGADLITFGRAEEIGGSSTG